MHWAAREVVSWIHSALSITKHQRGSTTIHVHRTLASSFKWVRHKGNPLHVRYPAHSAVKLPIGPLSTGFGGKLLHTRLIVRTVRATDSEVQWGTVWRILSVDLFLYTWKEALTSLFSFFPTPMAKVRHIATRKTAPQPQVSPHFLLDILFFEPFYLIIRFPPFPVD